MNQRLALPTGDYVSPEFSIILPDAAFPNMIVGDTNIQPWPYLRREIPHNWYVDQRQPAVGFVSRDEAHILYNTALQFKGKKALEIGCWLGWSACHLALAGVELDVIDPLLEIPDFYESVSNSLTAAGVIQSVNLLPGSSPQKVEELAAKFQRKWSLIFIDGNHEAPGPLNDAIACEPFAEHDALILFHDLASPDVAQGLDYFKERGWQTMVYQTMQIMGVAWRGNVEPVHHQPDPKVNWVLPAHLHHYKVSGRSHEPAVSQAPDSLVRQVKEMMQQAVAFINTGKPVDALRMAEAAASQGIAVPKMHYLRSICLSNVGRHKEALAAARAELTINPNDAEARQQVESLTYSLSQEKIKIPTQQRAWNTGLPRETMLSIQKASMNYSYRGVGMIKNPFDFAIYPLLIWQIQPRTIIEIGSKEGGSALWLGDMVTNYGLDTYIYSIDIVKVTNVQHPRVTFLEGDGRNLAQTVSDDFIRSLPRPLLVIEDADHAYETSKHVLDFFHPYLQVGEYIVVEDGIISDIIQDPNYNNGPHKALKEFLAQHQEEYEIDGDFCDYFGYNLTWCTNGFLKKIKEPSQDDFIDKLFNLVDRAEINSGLYQPPHSFNQEKFSDAIQQGKEFFIKGDFSNAIAHFMNAIAENPTSMTAHNYLSLLYWNIGNIQKSIQHHIFSQPRHTPSGGVEAEFEEILAVVRPYTMLSNERLFSLYSLAKQICLDDIPGNFVECGTWKGGSAALLAVVIQRYSLRPRKLYAFDTFAGMPQPAEVDRHSGVHADTIGYGEGSLKAPLSENLEVVCQALNVSEIVVPIPGLFADTLPQLKSEIGSIAFLHADGDWYESTMDIFNHLYDYVVASGIIQIDDYGYWEGCSKALHEFERLKGDFFPLCVIDSTGVWFQKADSVYQQSNHWRTFLQIAESAEKMNDFALAKKAARTVLKIVPRLAKAEALLFGYSSAPSQEIQVDEASAQETENFINTLGLRKTNLVVFPDWHQSEELLSQQLEQIILAVASHPDTNQIALLFDISTLSQEEANLILSGVAMNLLMEDQLQEENEPEVVLLENMTKKQWDALIPHIQYRICLDSENEQAVLQAGANHLRTLGWDDLQNL